MVFNLLTSLGLRQHHRVLDIGCGSLRVGRLLIPYLNAGNYFGVEPNEWLVQDGIANEVGRDLIRIKQPKICFAASLENFRSPLGIDFAIAQSIFSHCGVDLMRQWLSEVSHHLVETGALLATFLPSEEDCEDTGWIYPGCVHYRPETMRALASEYGLKFSPLDWAHPRQSWGLFAKSRYDRSLVDGGSISWNRFVAHTLGS